MARSGGLQAAGQAFSNPASLADGGGLRLALGASLATSAVRAEAQTGAWSTQTESGLATPPHAYLSWARGPGLVGISVNTAFAGGVRWPADGPTRFQSIASAPQFVRVAPFAGAAIGPVRFAAGAHLDLGGLRVERATDHVTEEGTTALDLRGRGIGFDLSLHVTASARWSVAATYQSRSQVNLSGWADFDVPVAFEATLPDQAVTTSLALPDRIVVGSAYEGEGWRVLGDLAATLWSVNTSYAFDFEAEETDDVLQRNAWRDSLALRAGAELDVAMVTLRGGGYVDGILGAPAPANTLSPASPDSARAAATIGAGVAIGEHFRIDGYGEHMQILPRSSTDGIEYRGSAWFAGLTGAAQF